VVAARGLTRLRIAAGHPLRAVDALLTGLHEPESSHLDLLSAFIQPERLRTVYLEAVEKRYLWHEFGDMNLII
jgi:S-adenosylmethionine:tRNA ribosyltransferase-isomerase